MPQGKENSAQRHPGDRNHTWPHDDTRFVDILDVTLLVFEFNGPATMRVPQRCQGNRPSCRSSGLWRGRQADKAGESRAAPEANKTLPSPPAAWRRN